MAATTLCMWQIIFMGRNHLRKSLFLWSESDDDHMISLIDRADAVPQLVPIFRQQKSRIALNKLFRDLRLDHSDGSRPNIIRFVPQIFQKLEIEFLPILFCYPCLIRVPLLLRVKAPKLWLIFGYDV